MKATITAIAMAMAAIAAQAADYTMGVNVGTVHNTPDHLNGTNPGAYVQDNETKLSAGIFWNSFRRVSVQVSRAFCTESGTWCVNLGAVTGYRQLPVMPLVIPSVRVSITDTVSIRLAALPQVGFTSKRSAGLGGVHLSIEAPL